MNALELLVLGRRLMKIAGDAMPAAGSDQVPSSVRSVAIDVSEHQDTSIGEIAARTGFPQSHVSLAVARLKDGGVFVTTVDPRDRRRTLVRASIAHAVGGAESPLATMASIDDALARALGTDNREELTAMIAA